MSRTRPLLVSQSKSPNELSAFPLKDKLTLLGLFLLPLIISLGPRFEIFGEIRFAHLRIQDFIVPPLFVAMSLIWMLNPRGQSDARLAKLSMMASALVVISAALAMMATAEGVELLIRLGFLYRLVVLAMIALLVLWGLRKQGVRGLLSLGFGFLVGVTVNFGWFFWQVVIERGYEAWRFTSIDPWNWGLVTIGEGAPFPAGQYVVLVLACSLAGTIVARSSWVRLNFAVVSFGLGLVLYLTQSRASIASGVVITVVAVFSLVSNNLLRSKLARFSLAVFLGSSAVVAYSWLAEGRLSPSGLMREFSKRSDIWDRNLQLVQGLEFFGLGPGGLRAAGGGEAHNIYLLLFSDYGALGLSVFFVVIALLAYSAVKLLSDTSSPTYQAIALIVLFFIINLLVSGFAQDTLNPVISSHLFATLIGAFLWVRQETALKLTPG